MIISVQDISKEPEAADPHPPAPTRSTKQRAPKPPAHQPPLPVVVSATPASISISTNPAPPISVSSTVAGWERSQSTLPSVGNTVDEVFSSNIRSRPSNLSTSVEKDKEQDASANSDASPTFSQVGSEIASIKINKHSAVKVTVFQPPAPLFLPLSSTQATAS